RGFSLIEILIAIGVLSALIFIFMSLASNMSKEQASLQSKMDSLLVQSLMTRSILGDLDNCNLSLQNIPFNVTSPPNSFTIPHFVTGPASSISAFVRDPSSTRTDGV